MEGSELRPALVLILNFVAGYLGVSFLVGWLRRRSKKSKWTDGPRTPRPPDPPGRL